MGVNVGKPDVLIKLDEENGKLTFDGMPVCDGQHGGSGGDTPLPAVPGTVALVDSFADLDPNAADGSLALAWNPEYEISPLVLGAYDPDDKEYLIPNKLVSFAQTMEYRESMYTNALQSFLSKYPLQYRQYWQGATFDGDCYRRGVFRNNGDGTYTAVTDTFSVGDDISGFWYADRDYCFYLEAYLCSTHKDWSIWDREHMSLSVVPVFTDAEDNIFVRERIECEGVLSDGVVAPNATTKYLIAAMWKGDAMHRTFQELFPGATKVGGNIYRVPLIFLYSFEEMSASVVSKVEDDSETGYHTEEVSFHLQAGWNALYVIGAIRLDPKDKEWVLEDASIDSVEPMTAAPVFSMQTDETGTIKYRREGTDLVLEGALTQKREAHPSGLYIKTENWQPIHAGMLPRIDGDINVLYERVDEMENDLEDNPPYHHNRQVLDRLYDDGGFLTYNGYRFRTVTSINFETRYDGFDSYIIRYSDGTEESFCIQHAPNRIESMTFYDSGQSCPNLCEVKYAGGTTQTANVSGLDLSVAFANFHDPMLHPARVFGDNRVYLKIGGLSPTEGGYSQYIDLAECDRDTAKLDYVDMMLGLGFETECLFERVRRNYSAAYWTLNHVRQAVAHGWITPEEFKSLTGGMTYEEDDTNDQN